MGGGASLLTHPACGNRPRVSVRLRTGARGGFAGGHVAVARGRKCAFDILVVRAGGGLETRYPAGVEPHWLGARGG